MDGFGDTRVWVTGILHPELVQHLEELVGFSLRTSRAVALDEQQQFGWGAVLNGGLLHGEVVAANGTQRSGGVLRPSVGDLEDELDEHGHGESVVDYGRFSFLRGAQKL